MNFREYVKDMAATFFRIVTLINVAMFIMGLTLDRNTSFGYEAFIFPIIYGIMGILPSLILYSPRELGVKEMLLRQILHFILLEAVILSFMFFNGIRDGKILLWVGISVAVICGLIYLLSILLDVKHSQMMTKELRVFQKRKKGKA